ncbi:MAG: hypothetical protein IT522_03260 [Burkholderiales bacterium]|nr:hypothetical protein [Burkholderiales bacterium]
MTSFARRIRSLLPAFALGFALSLAAVPPAAAATDYTDIWWNAAESGWGVNFVQSDQFMFATFFIYGPTKQPTWVTANLVKDAGGAFTGGVYLTTGTYYGAPWNPADVTVTQVGTATFTPTSPVAGTFAYSINGVNVSKTITRQTLTAISLAGKYYGGLVVTQANCKDPASNGTLSVPATITVSQVPNVSLQFVFDIVYSGITVQTTLGGATVQQGSLYGIPAATLAVTAPPTQLTAVATRIKRTALGVEGRWDAVTAGGCDQTATFSAAYTGP